MKYEELFVSTINWQNRQERSWIEMARKWKYRLLEPVEPWRGSRKN